jgi:hypothetical protein
MAKAPLTSCVKALPGAAPLGNLCLGFVLFFSTLTGAGAFAAALEVPTPPVAHPVGSEGTKLSSSPSVGTCDDVEPAARFAGGAAARWAWYSWERKSRCAVVAERLVTMSSCSGEDWGCQRDTGKFIEP